MSNIIREYKGNLLKDGSYKVYKAEISDVYENEITVFLNSGDLGTFILRKHDNEILIFKSTGEKETIFKPEIPLYDIFKDLAKEFLVKKS
ncbi:hypothetical protein ACR777_10405 [Sphingobacterium spiritivorum]|uniref:hypothetical protein n=1 Tax=Sphingobacterium spiritivorum TaxID=258 RepID=UPI003DA23AC8